MIYHVCAKPAWMDEIPTARWWEWINDGWVKLTLKPDEVLEWHRGGLTDEGWTSEGLRWEYDADFGYIERSYSSDSQDCDGRHGYYSDTRAHISRLRWREPVITDKEEQDPDYDSRYGEVLLPDWEKHTSRNYDQYAEMDGY